jgi:hypothetical protein
MKPKPRIGKTDSIFAKTTTGPAAERSPKASLPAGSSIENKLTVILPPDQVAFLDHLCLDIRAKTATKIRRTEVIRALIAGVRASGLDLTAYGTEADLAAVIAKRLKG